MSTEQAFLRETALPRIAESLYTTYGYDHVFLSSNGFGTKIMKTDPMYFRHLGSSRFKDTAPFEPEDPQLLQWVNQGSREDGYHALRSAMYWLPLFISGYNMDEECATIDRNLILVTDEVSFTYTDRHGTRRCVAQHLLISSGLGSRQRKHRGFFGGRPELDG
jgi:hypothetical protein